MEMFGIGERLRLLRSTKKLTLRQVSDRLGISVSSLSEYELDVKSPSCGNLLKLARLYGTSCDYILGNDGLRALDVSGLTDCEIASVAQIVALFRDRENRDGQ